MNDRCLHGARPQLKESAPRRSRLARKPSRDHGSALSLRQETATFLNPILPSHAADPWMIQHEGNYYYCESRNQSAIHVRKARSIPEIGQDDGVCVWVPPAHGMNSRSVWAPELHFLNGKWFIYFAADNGENENHRMWVLESETSDPQGRYIERGCLETEGWAIDGTVLTQADGQLYFIWSGWPGKVNGCQNLYISAMSDPCTLASERSLICAPEHPWETVDMPIAEGPQVLRRNGMTFIVYSASGSWTVDYCLGLLVNRDGDVLNPNSWEKLGPVFQKSTEVWGVGHCSFVRSPDQTEDWILYHAKSKQKKGWMDRQVHCQPFGWSDNGLPNFGTPWPAGAPLRVPAAGC